MPIPVHCPGCNVKLNAPDSAAGKNVKCPKCQTLMTIPVAQQASNDFDLVLEDQPAPKKPAVPPRKSAPLPTKRPAPVKSDIVVDDDDDDRPRKRKSRDDDDDDDDDRPRKKKKGQKKTIGPPMGMMIGGGLALLLLIGGGGYAIYHFAIKDKSKDTAGGGTGTDGGTKATPPSSWVPFKPVNGGFQVFLPSKPFNEKTLAPRTPTNATTPRAQEYNGRSAETKEFYTVVAIAYPDDMSAADKEKYMENSLKREMKMPEEFVKEVGRKEITLGGKQGRELVFEVEVAKGLAASGKNRPKAPDDDQIPEKAVVVLRTLIDGNRGYFLVSVALSGGRATQEKAFFDSFELAPETAADTNPAPKGGTAVPPKDTPIKK